MLYAIAIDRSSNRYGDDKDIGIDFDSRQLTIVAVVRHQKRGHLQGKCPKNYRIWQFNTNIK